MTIKQQIDAIQHVRTECQTAIHELECAVGVVPALPASLKILAALDALDKIQAHKLADPLRRQTVREAIGERQTG